MSAPQKTHSTPRSCTATLPQADGTILHCVRQERHSRHQSGNVAWAVRGGIPTGIRRSS